MEKSALMLKVKIGDVVELVKALGEVVLAVVVYNVRPLSPMLRTGAIGMAVVGALLSFLWAMGSSPARFRSNWLLGRPWLSFVLALSAYGGVSLAISYFNHNPPGVPFATLADYVIQLLYGAMFSFFVMSVCCLVRAVGIRLFE